MYSDTYSEEKVIDFDKNGADLLKVLRIDEERGVLIVKLARKQKAIDEIEKGQTVITEIAELVIQQARIKKSEEILYLGIVLGKLSGMDQISAMFKGLLSSSLE